MMKRKKIGEGKIGEMRVDGRIGERRPKKRCEKWKGKRKTGVSRPN